MSAVGATWRGLLVVGGLVCGACGQGSVSFQLDAPSDPALSPLGDPRRDSISLVDESSGRLGVSVDATGSAGTQEALGSLPVGTFNLRLNVTGGAQLLGLARARSVTISGGTNQTVTLHVRKPIAYFGSGQSFVQGGNGILPLPDHLMAIDSTLPAAPELTVPGGVVPSNSAGTVGTNDGRFLVASAGNTIFVVDTATESQVAAGQVMRGGAEIRDLAVAPDDSTLAIATDKGVAIVGDLQGFIGSGGSPIAETSLAPISRLAYSSDGTTVFALSGPLWTQLDCAHTSGTAIYTIPVADPGSASQMPGPPAATDVAFDPSGRVLVAEPCGRGITSDTQVVLGGGGIFDVVVAGPRVLGVEGTLASVTLPFDPDDPSIPDVQVQEGQVAMTDRATPTRYLIPPDRLTVLDDMTGNLVQVRLQPSTQVAYRAAASPDGTHVVYTNRVRYQANGFKFVDLVDAGTGDPIFYCTIDITRDVYHVTELDLDSGQVGYQSTRGIDDKFCQTTCTDCYLGPCQDSPPSPCSVNDGYAPDGVSILLGTR